MKLHTGTVKHLQWLYKGTCLIIKCTEIVTFEVKFDQESTITSRLRCFMYGLNKNLHIHHDEPNMKQ